MSDVSGIPNMGFGGGSYFGGNAATGQSAMSAGDINNSIWGRFSPGQAQQPLNNIFSNFGRQTDYYSALSAAYSRQIQQRQELAQAMMAQRAPMQYGWMHNEGAPAPNPYRAPMSYGWMHNEGAQAPAAPNPYSMGQFRPQTYGWDHNEGASRGFIGGGPANMFSPQPMGPTSGSATDGPSGYGPGIYQNSPFGMNPNPGS